MERIPKLTQVLGVAAVVYIFLSPFCVFGYLLGFIYERGWRVARGVLRHVANLPQGGAGNRSCHTLEWVPYSINKQQQQHSSLKQAIKQAIKLALKYQCDSVLGIAINSPRSKDQSWSISSCKSYIGQFAQVYISMNQLQLTIHCTLRWDPRRSCDELRIYRCTHSVACRRFILLPIYNSCPVTSCLTATKRFLQYLKSTIEFWLHISSNSYNNQLTG
jgi:hypothetical protein